MKAGVDVRPVAVVDVLVTNVCGAAVAVTQFLDPNAYYRPITVIGEWQLYAR